MNRWLVLTESVARRRRRRWPDQAQGMLLPPVVVPLEATTGDQVVLWRSKYGGAIVAIGTIVETVPVESANSVTQRALSRKDIEPTYAYCCAQVKYQFRLMSTPLTSDYLQLSELDMIIGQVPAGGYDWRNPTAGTSALRIDGGSWRQLSGLVKHVPPPLEWPTGWHIEPGNIVKSRHQIHAVYGGNGRARIASSATTPNLMIFLRPDSESPRGTGLQQDGTVQLLGAVEDMSPWVDQNLLVLDHVNQGVPVRMFQKVRQGYLYCGEYEVAQRHPIDRWEVVDRGVNSIGKAWERRVPVLRLHPVGACGIQPDAEDEMRGRPIGLSLEHRVVVDGRGVTSGKVYVEKSGNEPTLIRRLRSVLECDPSAAESIAALGDAQSVAALIQLTQRRRALAELRSVVESPTSVEHDIQKLLQDMPWVFGGEYLSGTARRRLTALDQLDMSLIRPDGSLHAVELKKAEIGKLVRRRGKNGELVVGARVNEAVGQAMNYLRSLDEQRDHILNVFKIDCRRASITVVIGHTAFVSADCDRKEILEAIRTYNSHLSRVCVITYDELLDRAEGALALGGLAQDN